MKVESIKAWYLHSRPSGDTSLRVSLLTREYGIIVALYKGGRIPRKKSFLQPFMSIWVSLDKHRDWYYIRHIESEATALHLPGRALYAALYLNEIIQLLIPPQESIPHVYDVYFSTLQALSEHHAEQIAQERSLRRFERVMLEVAGYSVSFLHDSRTGDPITSDRYYEFLPGVGFSRTEKGISGHYILNFANDKLDCVDTLKASKGFMRQALAFALNGKEIQTRKLYLASTQD